MWDNLFDKERKLCIQVDDLQIPMETKGTKIWFETRVPTDQELRACRMIKLISKCEWNPGIVSLESILTGSNSLKKKKNGRAISGPLG